MSDPSTTACEWAARETLRVRNWHAHTADRIRSAVCDLQEKLRQAAESKLRGISSMIIQRASLRVSIEEHDKRIEASDDVSLASYEKERSEVLGLLASKRIRPFSDYLLSRWSQLVHLKELADPGFLAPSLAPAKPLELKYDRFGDIAGESPAPVCVPHPVSHVIALTQRKLAHCRDTLPFHGSLAVLVRQLQRVTNCILRLARSPSDAPRDPRFTPLAHPDVSRPPFPPRVECGHIQGSGAHAINPRRRDLPRLPRRWARAPTAPGANSGRTDPGGGSLSEADLRRL